MKRRGGGEKKRKWSGRMREEVHTSAEVRKRVLGRCAALAHTKLRLCVRGREFCLIYAYYYVFFFFLFFLLLTQCAYGTIRIITGLRAGRLRRLAGAARPDVPCV